MSGNRYNLMTSSVSEGIANYVRLIGVNGRQGKHRDNSRQRGKYVRLIGNRLLVERLLTRDVETAS